MSARRRAGLLLAALLAAAAPSHAHAQGLNLNKNSDQPVEINADEGIEWRRDENVYIARGNAVAKRGDMRLRADTLTAHYRPVEGGGTDIFRLDAVGGVVIDSVNGKAVGDNGVYDVDNGVMVLKGRALKLVSEEYTVTARDSLEYWNDKQMAVARGDALVINADDRMSADIITAFFTDNSADNGPDRKGGAAGGKKTRAKPDAVGKDSKPPGSAADQPQGGQQIRRIEGFNNVHVSQPGQIALADKGVYDVESGIAVLFGSVKITREDNQLNGEYGEVDLNMGVSRILSGPPGAIGPQPVRGLFSPKHKPEIAPRDSSAGAAPAGGAPAGAGETPAPAPPAAAANVPTAAPTPSPLPYPAAMPRP